jgi:FkbM family methyltransferase
MCKYLFNELEEKIKVHNLALGDRKEAATIWYNNSSTGISTLLDPENTVRTPDDYQISETIHCEIFDHLYKEKNKKYLCKIDVEGFEEKIVKGMSRFLQENEVVLFIEIHDGGSPIFKTLADLGYRQLPIQSDDFIFSNMEVFSKKEYPTLKSVCADAGY